MKQAYVERDFRGDSLALIATMNRIVGEYVQQGYRLTVRQLYYQLVARALIENTERSYKRITSIVNDAKLAGLMDWDAIEDRTREFLRRGRWESGAALLRAAADQYHEDMWSTQSHRVFVVVEKEALAGVLERACRKLDIPLLAARGYPSGTVLREFALSDLAPALDAGQVPVILHLGDHDPSGIDMSRDLEERLLLFSEQTHVEFERIALNMEQIEEQRPPENPAKTTDARFATYRRIYGASSWELDALKPDYLAGLVESHAARYIDTGQWAERCAQVEAVRQRLKGMAAQFETAP